MAVPFCELHDLFTYRIHVFQQHKENKKIGKWLGLSVCHNVIIGNKGILSSLVLCGV